MKKSKTRKSKSKARSFEERKERKEGKGADAFVASAATQFTAAPKFLTSDRNQRRIVHKEAIATIHGSTAFACTRFEINPGLASTFPWLSTQAVGWEQYHFRYLKFEYITRAATSTIGSVILSPEYDALDPMPTTELMASNVMDAVESAPWRNSVCVMNTEAMFPLGPRKFVRQSIVNGDKRVYDCGALDLCRIDQSNGDMIGRLFVCYDIELSVPHNHLTHLELSNTSWFEAIEFKLCENGLETLLDGYVAKEDGLQIHVPAGAFFTLPRGMYRFYFQVQIEYRDTYSEFQTCAVELFAKQGAVILTRTGTVHNKMVNFGNLVLPVSGVVSSDDIAQTINFELLAAWPDDANRSMHWCNTTLLLTAA